MSSSAAIGAQLSNLRAAIPPPLRTICFPDNLSIFLRNTIIAIGVLNICLFFAAILTWPSRYLGSTTMMVSVVSMAHITYVSIILGNHLVHGISPHQIQVGGFVDQLKSMSARYQSVFAHGTAFGSTAFMALLMHVVWAYFARVNDCVVNLDNRIQHACVAIHEWELMCIHPIKYGGFKSFFGFDGVLLHTSGGALHPGT